jgi:hypothetical protein
VAAAAVATVLVVARARSIEVVAAELAHEVARLREVRLRLAALRRATVETDELVATFRATHSHDGIRP